MQKVVSEAVRTIANKMTKDIEYRYWVARTLPKMGGGQRQMLVDAVAASGIMDERLERAIRCPKTEDIIREPKKTNLIQ